MFVLELNGIITKTREMGKEIEKIKVEKWTY